MYQNWIEKYENIIKKSEIKESEFKKETNNEHLLRNKIMNIKDSFAFWLLEL